MRKGLGAPPAGTAEDFAAPTVAATRRSRLWELASSLHCSIIGTCLTTSELRGLVRKFNATRRENPTDHDLHSLVVAAAGRHDPFAKQIQKMLDQRHKGAIKRFAAARDEAGLRILWQEAMQTGDVPGAYWAVLSHPSSTDALVRKVFGDVHMLSHLVGAANRADIRRLHRLEEEKTTLEEKLARQQDALRDAVTSRDIKIRELTDLLSARIESKASGADGADGSAPISGLERLVADLRKQLDSEIRRRERAERRAEETATARAANDDACSSMKRQLDALRAELEVAEARLVPTGDAEAAAPGAWSLQGLTILYVGGRTHHIPRLRQVVEGAAGAFIHHDGGIEERPDLLPGLVSRADIAVFPVDCVSHRAALSLKRVCRQFGKPFVPLRSSGLGSFLHGLQSAVSPQTD